MSDRQDTFLLHQLVTGAAERAPLATALASGAASLSYGELAQRVSAFAAGLLGLGLARIDRVGIFLEKRFEFVVAAFGTSSAGGVFVPINPILKSAQVAHILNDCQVRFLVTSEERLPLVEAALQACPHLRGVIVTGSSRRAAAGVPQPVHPWDSLAAAAARPSPRAIDTDIVSILYTSGSTGKPKGVVLSHRNMVAGAKSVASYLENNAHDRLLAALPLSFDAGFSQLTTAFHAGAQVVLLNYLTPQELLECAATHRITGLTGVPPLWTQLSGLDWPEPARAHLRYFANTGGRMPLKTLERLRAALPGARPFLMYGLTEAFRATFLDPAEVDRRPDSIGKAIPNAEVLVLREDGTECAPDEPGELVQRGALVAQGYWNDPATTAERFKALPAAISGRDPSLTIPEVAVYSGDTVRRDAEGFLYFVGRKDEMIKASGYRVSPTEIEEVLYTVEGVQECAAFGVPGEAGEDVGAVVMQAKGAALNAETILRQCRRQLASYMVPGLLEVRDSPLPRNANGKLDRKQLRGDLVKRLESDRR